MLDRQLLGFEGKGVPMHHQAQDISNLDAPSMTMLREFHFAEWRSMFAAERTAWIEANVVVTGVDNPDDANVDTRARSDFFKLGDDAWPMSEAWSGCCSSWRPIGLHRSSPAQAPCNFSCSHDVGSAQVGASVGASSEFLKDAGIRVYEQCLM
jgi:hypothetical protein